MPNHHCLPVFTYFVSQWMTTMTPDLWNTFDDPDDRSTNRVEGFHSKLNRVIISSHPSLFVLINIFKKLETEYAILMLAIANGMYFI